MAASDAKPLPIYGVAHREYGFVRSSTTFQVLTGGLASLAVTGSIDGGAFAATGLTIAEIGTTGLVSIDIDVTRMTCNHLALKVTATGAQDLTIDIYPSLYYLPQTDATNKAVLIQSGTGMGQIDLSSGQTKVQNGTSSGQIAATSGRIKLASDAFDVAVGSSETSAPTTWGHYLRRMHSYLFNKNVVDGGVQTVYKEDGSTVLSTGTVTSGGPNDCTRGDMS